MNAGEAGDRIEAFIRERFDVSGSDPRFSRGADLFEQGYIDSVGVAELVAFIEGEFRIELPEQDLMSDEFSTIDGIAHIALRCLGDPIDEASEGP